MPRLSQLYIRFAFIYLLLGFTIGSLLLAHKGVPIHPALWILLPAHMEFLLFGWIVQLTMGVAFWILPRFWKAPRRGNETGAQIALVLLNVGIWLIVIGSWLSPILPLRHYLMASGRLLEIGAAVAFASHLWPRVVSREG